MASDEFLKQRTCNGFTLIPLRFFIMRNLLLVLLLLISSNLLSQICSNLGQNPGTAFPVCGSSTFEQSSVAICGSRTIPTPCTASGSIFQDKNPYWYRFTCFKAGTLAFQIVPINQDDDYDWQLFDVTGKDPSMVYTDRSLFVACNWSGEGGNTGARAGANSLAVCEGLGKPLFSKMPDLIEGHNYLLLVSHFTDSQSGYSLSFGGGSSSITDTTASTVTSAKPNCDGKLITLHINKKISCSSLAANGSDFSISSASAKIVSASGINCTNAFDMDSLVLSLDNPLPPGNYTITTQKGNDGNTLLDYCQTPMAEGITASFTIKSLQPTPFDSISAVGCAPNELNLVFSKPIQCNSVAANGSDFTINAASGVTVTSATVECSNNLTSTIKLTLSGAINTQGTQTVTLVMGSDGNTIIDECSQQTPAGSSVSFNTKDTVAATILYNIKYGCKADTLQFSANGNNGINEWAWKFNERASSGQQNPFYIYTQFGQQQVRLTVSNGVCRDSASVDFILDNELKANFSAPTLLCPEDPAVFRDTSIGKIINWKWDFGNGSISLLQNPPIQNYTPATTTKIYPIRLIVQNDRNCFDTATKQLKVLNNCYIAVATAFTPNGDGLNDYLYPINAFKANDLTFRVYNRFGQVLFETKDFANKWDGTFKGLPQASGTYVWTLQYTHADSGQPFSMRGTSVLIR